MELDAVKAILGSRIMITEPGKFKVKVTAVNPWDDRNICNFNAMTPYHATLTKADIADGNLDECLNHNLSSGQRMGKDYTPVKGEFVNIHVDYVAVKNSEDQALLVTAVEQIKAAATTAVSVDSFFDEEPATKASAKSTAAALETK